MKKPARKFTSEQDAKLIEYAQEHTRQWGTIMWKQIQQDAMFSAFQVQTLFQRYHRVIHPKLKRHTEWTPDEDARLLEAVQVHGKKWSYIARIVFEQTRCDVWCRSRYHLLMATKSKARLEEPKTIPSSDEDVIFQYMAIQD